MKNILNLNQLINFVPSIKIILYGIIWIVEIKNYSYKVFKINKLGNYLTKKGLVNTLIEAKYNNEI